MIKRMKARPNSINLNSKTVEPEVRGGAGKAPSSGGDGFCGDTPGGHSEKENGNNGGHLQSGGDMNGDDDKDKGKQKEEVSSYKLGPWRVVVSDEFGTAFYYNENTKVGQFKVPSDLVGDDCKEETLSGHGDDRGIYATEGSNANKGPMMDLTANDDRSEEDVLEDEGGLRRSQGSSHSTVSATQTQTQGDAEPESTQQEALNWQCSACTLVNDMSRHKCEACDGPAPPEVVKRTRSKRKLASGGVFAALSANQKTSQGPKKGRKVRR